MDSMSAFFRGQAARASGAKQMVFDWDKAAQLIRDRGATDVEAGLAGDWGYTGGVMLRNGEPVLDEYTYLSSNWATPQINFCDGTGMDCWRYADESPGWDAGTKWPDSALAILRGDSCPAE